MVPEQAFPRPSGDGENQRDYDIRTTIQSYSDAAVDYARWSASYGSFPGLRETLQEFEDRLPGELPVLDAGCGGGRDARELAAGGRNVIALDMSAALLAAWPEDAGENVHRVVGDMVAPPIRAESIGGIWACASLFHQSVEYLPVVVANLLGLLVPGGVFAASLRYKERSSPEGLAPIGGPRRTVLIPRAEFLAILARLNLVDIGSRDSGPGWYTAWGIKP